MFTQDLAKLSAEWEGRRLLLAFYRAIDEARFDDVVAFFAADGEWQRRGSVLRGHAEIAKTYEGRTAATRARHVISNVETTAEADGTVSFSLYITFYTGTASADVPTIAGPSMMLTSIGTLKRVGSDWRISRKETIREFLFATAAAG